MTTAQTRPPPAGAQDAGAGYGHDASSDIKKVVTKVSDSIKKTLSGGNDHDDDKGDGGEGAAP